MPRKSTLFFVLFVISALTWAQESRPVIRFTPFVSQGISKEETRFIESLIQSYISEAGELIFHYDNIPTNAYLSAGGLLTDSWNKSPDYILSGNISLEWKTRIFTLEINDTRTNKVTKITTAHRTAGDMVLKSRSLVESILKFPVISAIESMPNEAGPENPKGITEDRITGIWRGVLTAEPAGGQGSTPASEIEIIRLQSGGRGTAFFSSGVKMNLGYAIDGTTLRIWQNSPNAERFYYPNPPEIAKLLFRQAEPMRWEFMLYSEGSMLLLKGTKISTEVRILQNGNAELAYSTARDAFLYRSYY